MTEDLAAEVLICGAGAAGLTLAIDLARRGISFRLIEKMDDPFRGSRGKGIQPRTQEIFEDLGIIDRIVAVGGRYPPQREYRDDGSYAESAVVEPEDPTPAEPYHIALLVPQFLTERVMRGDRCGHARSRHRLRGRRRQLPGRRRHRSRGVRSPGRPWPRYPRISCAACGSGA